MSNRGQITGEAALYRRLAEMTAAAEQGVLATVIATRLSTPRHEGSKMIVHADGSVTGSVGGGKAEAVVLEAAREVMADGVCRRLELDLAGDLGVCGGHMEVFLEPVLRSAPFVVIGAGHVGRALVELGGHLSFHFTVVDDRPEFLQPLSDLPRVKTLLAAAAEVGSRLEITETCGILVASRSHVLDAEYLEAILRAEHQAGRRFGFLGVLGSRSKAARLRKQMETLSPEFAERMATVQLPVGLEIGAETPGEIALSVLAEAVAVLRGIPYLQDQDGRDLGIRLQRRRPAGENP